ncbi:MAG: rRNA maturation RNase YbeY [Candidatus Omnitrophica bacterium]|nr:rRNA maturation RNase YbeY [Candidatus Omnitrophota bacterium]MBI5023501.1 rRNA maturation RNase YbeY [Candidatus Omnitrophota bacterium]
MAVESLQKKVPIKLASIGRIARTILKYEGVREASLSIVFVSSPKIRSLNRQYLRRDYVTDVLAFDLRDGYRPGQVNGDIAICVDMALKNAAAYQTSCARELVLYVAHGILHLLGFDDHSPRDIREMRKKEQEILSYLGKKTETVVSCRFTD